MHRNELASPGQNVGDFEGNIGGQLFGQWEDVALPMRPVPGVACVVNVDVQVWPIQQRQLVGLPKLLHGRQVFTLGQLSVTGRKNTLTQQAALPAAAPRDIGLAGHLVVHQPARQHASRFAAALDGGKLVCQPGGRVPVVVVPLGKVLALTGLDRQVAQRAQRLARQCGNFHQTDVRRPQSLYIGFGGHVIRLPYDQQFARRIGLPQKTIQRATHQGHPASGNTNTADVGIIHAWFVLQMGEKLAGFEEQFEFRRIGTIHLLGAENLPKFELHLATVAIQKFKYRGGRRVALCDWMIANTLRDVVLQRVFKRAWRAAMTSLGKSGFEAQCALDKDAAGVADGIFNANDIAYAEFKLWRDLNQDGVSQANELLGMAESGVTAINLVQTAAQTTQGKSTFTQTVTTTEANGEPVTGSREQTVQNVNFTQNTFYRALSDNPVVAEAAAALPQIKGAGLVRDLWEAMSLGLRAQGEKTGNCQRKRAKVRQRSRCKFSVRKTPIVPKLGFIGSEKHFSEKVQAL